MRPCFGWEGSMRIVLALIACIAMASIAEAASIERLESRPLSKKPMRVAIMCFLQGEEVSGFNKICYYDCLGSRTAITIQAVQLCPLNINR